jgi:hypothetical protein
MLRATSILDWGADGTSSTTGPDEGEIVRNFHAALHAGDADPVRIMHARARLRCSMVQAISVSNLCCKFRDFVQPTLYATTLFLWPPEILDLTAFYVCLPSAL